MYQRRGREAHCFGYHAWRSANPNPPQQISTCLAGVLRHLGGVQNTLKKPPGSLRKALLVKNLTSILKKFVCLWVPDPFAMPLNGCGCPTTQMTASGSLRDEKALLLANNDYTLYSSGCQMLFSKTGLYLQCNRVCLLFDFYRTGS